MVKQAATYSPTSKQQVDIPPMTESSPKVTTKIITTEISEVKTPMEEDHKDTTVIHKVPFNLVSWENLKKKVPSEGKI